MSLLAGVVKVQFLSTTRFSFTCGPFPKHEMVMSYIRAFTCATNDLPAFARLQRAALFSE